MSRAVCKKTLAASYGGVQLRQVGTCTAGIGPSTLINIQISLISFNRGRAMRRTSGGGGPLPRGPKPQHGVWVAVSAARAEVRGSSHRAAHSA